MRLSAANNAKGWGKENTFVRLLERCPQRANIFILLARARTHADSGFIKTNIRHLKVNSLLLVSFSVSLLIARSFKCSAERTQQKLSKRSNGKRQKPVVFICEQRERKKKQRRVFGCTFPLVGSTPRHHHHPHRAKGIRVCIVPPLFHYHFT